MEITSIVISAIAGHIVSRLSENLRARKQTRLGIETNLTAHLNEVLTWSERVQLYGMTAAQPTDTSTVELTLDSVPRRFRPMRGRAASVAEDSLLSERGHYLLLGDPGSGKTTTLKRLARKMFRQAPTSKLDHYQYPIVVRIRELDRDSSLYTTIANLLGLKYSVVQIEDRQQKGLGIVHHKVETLIDGVPIKSVIADVLNASKALLLLDGLDEVDSQRRHSLENELQGLAYMLRDAKIILTSRSGDFVSHIDGFDIVEICPLNRQQITAIAHRWLDEPNKFLEHLTTVPYYDLADRPLFLIQLVLFFNRHAYLPEQPSEVYKRVITLMLEEWDAQRKITRKSKYAFFYPERKIEFLAALAYHLTYKTRTKVFSTADLIDAYLYVHQRFGLPESEAKDVAGEIETHTGIIVEGSDRYEFSHLSLQEYLCGYYLVREPWADHLVDYMSIYPTPLAVAVVLSSNPTNWFASLFLREQNIHRATAASTSVFLSRLALEKPTFSPSPYFGLAILTLFFKFGRDSTMCHLLSDLMTLPGTSRSLAESLMWFAIDPTMSFLTDHLYLRRRFHIANSYGFVAPEGGHFPTDLLRKITADHGVQLVALEPEHGVVKPYTFG